MNVYQLLFFLFIVNILVSCKKENEVKQETKHLNSFTMNVNDQLWQPSLIENDPCYSTFDCEMSEINQVPYYRIRAYKNSQLKSGNMSDNIFRIQIMNVKNIGVYNISDSFGTFNSYAWFIINESGSQKIYENSKKENECIVTIEKLITNNGSILKGIEGSFSGILYNNADPSDFIVIDSCKFTFSKINTYNFCQCAE